VVLAVFFLHRLPAVAPPEPEPMIYIAPAPAPLGVSGGIPEAPPLEEPKPVVMPVPKPQRLVAPAKPKRRPAPPPAEAPAPAGTAEGIAAGTAGGTPGGIVGGVVGGIGDAPMRAHVVAHPPVAVSRVQPVYPPAARARLIEGQILLEVVVDRQGAVEDDVRITKSIPLLEAAAVAAVRRWRFTPGRDAAGRPVRVLLEVPIRFQLR
jgi:protein TonB